MSLFIQEGEEWTVKNGGDGKFTAYPKSGTDSCMVIVGGLVDPSLELDVYRLPATDYRALLLKYMRHILDAEGITYIDEGGAHSICNGVKFTESENAALIALSEEAIKTQDN